MWRRVGVGYIRQMRSGGRAKMEVEGEMQCGGGFDVSDVLCCWCHGVPVGSLN